MHIKLLQNLLSVWLANSEDANSHNINKIYSQEVTKVAQDLSSQMFYLTFPLLSSVYSPSSTKKNAIYIAT